MMIIKTMTGEEEEEILLSTYAYQRTTLLITLAAHYQHTYLLLIINECMPRNRERCLLLHSTRIPLQR